MDWITDSVREIAVFLILVSVITNFIPEGNYKKYIRVISGIIIILIVINPIQKIFHGDEFTVMFENEYKKKELIEMKISMDGINSEIYQKTLEEYEKEIGNYIKNQLEERGFNIRNICIKMDVDKDVLYLKEVFIEVGDRYGTYNEGVGKSTGEFIKSYLCEEYGIEEEIICVEY